MSDTPTQLTDAFRNIPRTDAVDEMTRLYKHAEDQERRAIAAEKRADEWREVANKLHECERQWCEAFAEDRLVDSFDTEALEAHRALVEREKVTA